MGRLADAAAIVAVVAGAGTLFVRQADAHKPITSKYTYNEHVFPILRDRCGGCHVDGGIAPMSLLTYKDARPWVESIREELISERMPPWYLDMAGAALVKNGDALSAKELDTLIVWATGGTPEGDPARTPGPPRPRGPWPAGPPDLVLQASAYTVAGDRTEDQHEFFLPTGITGVRWLKGADLLPGTPSMVRDATISIENGPVLAAWVPGEPPTLLQNDAAFRLEAGTKLRLRIHYRKPWQDERKARTDRSAVGLYLAPAPPAGRELRDVTVDGGAPAGISSVSATRTLAQPARVYAVRPHVDRPYARLEVAARTAAGQRVPLLLLRAARPDWPRRYWLRQPINLPANTRLEITAVPAARDPGQTVTVTPGGLSVSLDVTQ